MKKGILFISLLTGLAASAQEPTKKTESLKDLLYSGKLKKDSSGVVRKTDDLSTKIDTTTKKVVVDTPKVKVINTATAPTKTSGQPNDPAPIDAGNDGIVAPADAGVAAAAVPAAKAPTKSNTKIWKEYTDSMAPILKEEVLNSKKIKKGTYYIFVEYELEPDGKVSIVNVTSTPESDMLVAQVKLRMESYLPPLHAEANQTKKLKKKTSFNITKD